MQRRVRSTALGAFVGLQDLRSRLVVLVLAALLPGTARATGRDFIDETLVSRSFRPRSFGLELGLDSRLDSTYRMQGWYGLETELAVTSHVLLEAVGLAVGQGDGDLDFAGWRAGGRVRIPTGDRLPVDLSLAVEYETETTAAKHPETESELIVRGVVTRMLPHRIIATVNLGAAHRLTGNEVTRFAWAVGARWPEEQPLMVGLEVVREPLELDTRIAPQLSLRFPHRMRVRLGGAFSIEPRPYWFVGRVILEKGFGK